MGPVEAIIFDMDGTLVDSIPWHAKSWEVFGQRHHLGLPIDELMRRTNGRNGAECMRVLLGDQLSDEEAWARIHEKEEIYREMFAPHFTPVPGAHAFMAATHARGLRVAVGTAGDQANIAFVMQHLRPEPAPHAIVGGDEGLPGKPEPAIFLEAARRIGARAAHTIVFEDAPLGIEAARRAGMHAVAVCTTHTADELGGPHVIRAIKNFQELLDDSFLETLHVITP